MMGIISRQVRLAPPLPDQWERAAQTAEAGKNRVASRLPGSLGSCYLSAPIMASAMGALEAGFWPVKRFRSCTLYAWYAGPPECFAPF